MPIKARSSFDLDNLELKEGVAAEREGGQGEVAVVVGIRIIESRLDVEERAQAKPVVNSADIFDAWDEAEAVFAAEADIATDIPVVSRLSL